jgi:glucokinase
LAEWRFGAGRGFRHLIFAVIGTGIGGGIIIDGKLFRGTYGSAGEIGHMLITPDLGFVCGCGNSGCFMSHASGLYIAKYAAHMIENGMESIIPKSAGWNR